MSISFSESLENCTVGGFRLDGGVDMTIRAATRGGRKQKKGMNAACQGSKEEKKKTEPSSFGCDYSVDHREIWWLH